MTRAKYVQPPGPFRTRKQIRQSHFHFSQDQWRKLTGLLPCKLGELSAPSDYTPTVQHKPRRSLNTIADIVIHETEGAIKAHLTGTFAELQITPSKVRAAIRNLRHALRPFAHGWVDSETASIVSVDLDAKLVVRDKEIAKMRLPSGRLRALAMLCQLIEVQVRHWALANGEALNEREMLRYIDSALIFAGIKHPNISKHRDRLAALVFPKDVMPHSQG